MKRSVLFGMFCVNALAQGVPAPSNPDHSKNAEDPVLWATGLASYFQKFHNPVVASYASADLATSLCTRDKGAASGVFRQSNSGRK